MAMIGSLVADLAANSAAFNRDMDTASRNLRSNSAAMNRSLGAIDRQFARVRAGAQNMARSVFSIRGAVAGLAAAGGIAYAGRQALQAADDMAKLADQTGFTVEQISALTYQARQTGAGDVLASGARTLAQTMGNLQNNTGRLFSFVQRYDQALLESLQNSTTQEQRLRLLADAIRDETDAAQRGALARAAFGGAGAQLVNTFVGGTAAMERYNREAEEMNLIQGEQGARSAERLNDRIDQLTRQLRMRFQVAVTDTADDILTLVEAMASLTTGAINAGAAVSRALNMGRGEAQRAPEDAARRLEEAAQMFTLRATGARRGDIRTEEAMIRRAIGTRDGGEINSEFRDTLRAAEDLPEAYLQAAARLREEAAKVRNDAQALEELNRLAADENRRSGPAGGAATTGDSERRSPAPDTLTSMLDGVTADLAARREEIAAAGRALFDATRTSAESYAIELERIAALQSQGAFADAGGDDTAMRARVAALVQMAGETNELATALAEVRRLSSEGLLDPEMTAQARREIQALADDARTLMDEVRSAGDNILNNAQSEVLAFATGFQKMGDTVRGVIRAIVRELANLALQRLAFDPLRAGMDTVLKNLMGGGGNAAGPAKPIPKFQRGGRFSVAGVGGVDSKLVMFKATPGEDVQVTPSGAAGRGGGAVGVMGASVMVHQPVHLHLEGAVVTQDLLDQANAAAALAYDKAVKDGAQLALSTLAKGRRHAL